MSESRVWFALGEGPMEHLGHNQVGAPIVSDGKSVITMVQCGGLDEDGCLLFDPDPL